MGSGMMTRYPGGGIRAQDQAARYRKTSEIIGSSSLAMGLRSAHIAAMNTDTDTPSTGAQRRFKYTRELIKIAREDLTGHRAPCSLRPRQPLWRRTAVAHI